MNDEAKIEIAPPQVTAKPVEKSQADVAKERQDAAIAAQKERTAKIEARAVELRAYKGRCFHPKVPREQFPNEIVQVIDYGGVAKTMQGDAHIFHVESWLPRAIWRPIASQFLSEYEETTDSIPEQTKPNLPA